MIKILAVFLIIDVIFELIFVNQNYRKGRMITKPLLMPLLICVYISASSALNYMIITALVFCFIGDVLLLGPEGKAAFLKAGLASFLAGHICYIYAFISSAGPLTDAPFHYLLFILPFIFGFVFFYLKLGDKPGPMKIPVLIYAAVILLMSFSTLARGYDIDGRGFWLPFIGSIFFLISDFSIAHSLFIKKSGGSSVLIMATYILAQVLIVAGFIW